VDLSEWERINIFHLNALSLMSCIDRIVSLCLNGVVLVSRRRKKNIAWEDNHGKRDILFDCRSWKIFFKPFFFFLLLIFLLRKRNWLFVVQIVVMNEKKISSSSSYIFRISSPLTLDDVRRVDFYKIPFTFTLFFFWFFYSDSFKNANFQSLW